MDDSAEVSEKDYKKGQLVKGGQGVDKKPRQ